MFKEIYSDINVNRKQYLFSLLLLVIILIPNFCLLLVSPDFKGASITKGLIYLITSFTFLILPLTFLRPKLYFFIFSLAILLQPVELVNIFLYQSSISTGTISLIIDTHFNEAVELIMGLWLFVMLLLAIMSFYVYLTIKKINYTFTLPGKLKVSILFTALTLYLFLFSREFWLDYKYINPYRPISYNLESAKDNVKYKFYKIFPFNFYFHTKITIENRIEINKSLEKLKDFKFNAIKKDSLSFTENYVLVIGETARAYNWELYGYSRKTNTYTRELSNISLMKNCYSPANMTSLSIPLLFTRATADSFENVYKEKTFIKAFKEAGFSTYWISNQPIFNSRIAILTADVDSFINLNLKSENQVNYDSVVFEPLEKIIKNKANKRLIIINIMGSHFRYNFRYPEEFKVYTPTMEGAFDYSLITVENKEKMVNAYDNSILYTDYILSKIIKKLDSSKNGVSLMLYISDHGENLFDTKENIFSHCTEAPNKFELHVPFMVWYSELYQKQYPDKIKNMNLNSSKSISSSVIFHSILDAANIAIPNQMDIKSIFSLSLKEDSTIKVFVPSENVYSYKVIDR